MRVKDDIGYTIKKYFRIQTVFMILMTCLMARLIYENDRIERKLEELHKLLLSRDNAAVGIGDYNYSSDSRTEYLNNSAAGRTGNPNADMMEQTMNKMQPGEERFINGYRVRKIR